MEETILFRINVYLIIEIIKDCVPLIRIDKIHANSVQSQLLMGVP